MEIAAQLSLLFYCSSVAGDEHDQKQGVQDSRQKSVKDEEVCSKKTKTSQLVQEEKAESGNVSSKILLTL